MRAEIVPACKAEKVLFCPGQIAASGTDGVEKIKVIALSEAQALELGIAAEELLGKRATRPLACQKMPELLDFTKGTVMRGYAGIRFESALAAQGLTEQYCTPDPFWTFGVELG